MVSTPEQETLQEKLQTTIKGTFPLFTLTLRFDSFLLKFAFSNHFGNFSLPIVLLNRSNLIFREDFFPGSVAGNAPVAHSRNWLYHRDLTEDLACFDEAERHFMLYVYSTYTGVLTQCKLTFMVMLCCLVGVSGICFPIGAIAGPIPCCCGILDCI